MDTVAPDMFPGIKTPEIELQLIQKSPMGEELIQHVSSVN
jgi:hypothetical protein